MVLPQNIKHKLISLAIGVSAALFPTVALAAEKITFSLKPFGEFQIEVEDLEAFVATGARTTELDYYLKRLTPEQLAQLPKVLSTPLKLNPLTIAKFSNSTVGEVAIANLGKGIRASPTRNGFYALRSAIIAAAFDDKGLNLINLLRHYPLETVYVDLGVLTQYLQRGAEIAQYRQAIDRIWFAEDGNNNAVNLPKNSDRAALSISAQSQALQTSGIYEWQKQTLTYNSNGKGLFDLYQPQTEGSVPLIAISHGVASNRQTFAYLGKHLASHGFAVAVIEHEEINLDKFDRVLAGIEPFPEVENLIDRPRDVVAVLDRLESETNINLQQVGVIGQSFGGYGALALSGAKLNPQSDSQCQPESYTNVLLDLSSLAQCAFIRGNLSQLELQDSRVKAVVAINPMAKIFGRGINSVGTPTMIISGTNDRIMPPVAEQVKPFAKLDDNLDKYLVMVKPATHFSFLQEGLGILPVPDGVVGPRPIYAHPILKALTTAFFQVHLARQSEYQTYLDRDLTQLSNNAFELSVIRSLSEIELEVFE